MIRVVMIVGLALGLSGCLMHGLSRARYFERTSDDTRMMCGGETFVVGILSAEADSEAAERRAQECEKQARGEGYTEISAKAFEKNARARSAVWRR